jgi:hypothetical protein
MNTSAPVEELMASRKRPPIIGDDHRTGIGSVAVPW